jgi:predicted Zn-dependent peptidase
LYQKTTLPNGLRLVTANMPHTRSVAIGFFIGIGSRYESEPQGGIYHFIEHMCFKGTSRRKTPSEISAAIEGVGGLLNGGTDKEMTVYWCKVAQQHFELAMDVLTDMFLNSRFDIADIEKERQVIIEEIRMTKDAPSQEVALLIDGILWPDHPLGRDTAGSKESVGAMTRDMLVDCIKSRYLPSNTVIAISGSVEHEQALRTVEQALGKWDTKTTTPSYVPYTDLRNPRIKVQKRDIEQAHICIGLPGISLQDPKRFIHDILNVILGEGMSSRLFTEIRENLGLAYSIFSYVDHFLDSGAMTVSAAVEPGNLPVAIKATMEQLIKMKQEKVPEEELIKAKELSKGRILLRMEDSRNVNGWIGAQEILTGEILTIDDVIQAIDSVTSNQIQDLSRELLVGDRLRLAVVGPIDYDKSLEKLLKL